MSENAKKLCVLFPGIGYHCDKPLLYYSEKLARSKGYETKKLEFSGFGSKEEAPFHALALAEKQLEEVDFSAYSRVVFIGKSLGTIVCLAYRDSKKIGADAVLLTPLTFTFDFPAQNCTAFHGTADPWAATADIERLCREKGVPLYTYPGANHSLETGRTLDDIAAMSDIIGKIAAIIE
jgi:phosphoglycolate phosphatase